MDPFLPTWLALHAGHPGWVAVLVVGWGMELQRFALRGMLSVALGIGPDAALLVLGGLLAAVSAVGWALVGWWALR